MRLSRYLSALASAAIAALALIAAGCGSSSSSNAGGGSSTPTSTAPASTSAAANGSTGTSTGSSGSSSAGVNVGTGTIKAHDTKTILVLDQSSPAYSYGLALANGAKAEGKKLGYNIDVSYDNLNAQTELSNFQQAIASGKYGGIIIEPFNTQLCIPLRTEPVKYKVLVEIVGTPVCDKGSGTGAKLWAPGTISFIGGQNTATGAAEVLETAAKLQKGPQNVAFIFGPNGYASDVAWQVAWKPFAAAHPDWKLVATEYGDFTTPTSFQLAENALSGNKNITVMFDPYIDATVGVVKAVQASGRASQVSVYSNGGGSSVAAKLVKAGELKGDLPVYPESLGTTGVKNMVAALHGQAPPRYVPGDGNPHADQTGVITKANIAQYKPQW